MNFVISKINMYGKKLSNNKDRYNSIKKTGLLEIIKAGIGDGLTLYLIYGLKYS